MFILPHHFQAAQRSWIHEAQRTSGLDHPYNWGLRHCVLDVNALTNSRLVVHALRARLPDGTVITIPEDGVLPLLDLRKAFQGNASVDVFLALPLLDLSRNNVSPDGSAETTRFARGTVEINDESTGDNPKPIEVLRPKYKLLPSTEDCAGYEILPIARIQRATQEGGGLKLDNTYIPPVLACDAWKVLQTDILQDISNFIGAHIDVLAKTVDARGIEFDSGVKGEQKYFQPLRVLNEAYSVLEILSYAEGVHPFTAYLMLCQLVGQLCILGDARRPPMLPKYNHDDLGNCFYPVKQYILEYLRRLPQPDYTEVDFIGVGKRIQLVRDLESSELTRAFYIGVESSTLPPDTCRRLFTNPLQPNMKIGSPEKVAEIFSRKTDGLVFVPVTSPPLALPSRPGLVFFEINLQKSLDEEWQHVQRERKRAIRLSETVMPGDIDGLRKLVVREEKTATQRFDVSFKLFILRS